MKTLCVDGMVSLRIRLCLVFMVVMEVAVVVHDATAQKEKRDSRLALANVRHLDHRRKSTMK